MRISSKLLQHTTRARNASKNFTVYLHIQKQSITSLESYAISITGNLRERTLIPILLDKSRRSEVASPRRLRSPRTFGDLLTASPPMVNQHQYPLDGEFRKALSPMNLARPTLE